LKLEVWGDAAHELSLGRAVGAILAGHVHTGEQHGRDQGGDKEQD
jgi:hypothetical protein